MESSNKESTSHLKIVTQFKSTIESPVFAEKIRKTRKTLGFPRNGFPRNKENLKRMRKLIMIPDSFFVKKFNTTADSRGSRQKNEFMKIYNKEIYKLSLGFSIKSDTVFRLIEKYLVFNKFFFKSNNSMENIFKTENLCMVTSSNIERDIYELSSDEDGNSISYEYKDEFPGYPVVLRIAANASLRDILDYVRNNSNLIMSIQNNYITGEEGVTKYKRTKSNPTIRERNNLIWELHSKKLSAKEIQRELFKNKAFSELELDVGSINKVISNIRIKLYGRQSGS